MKTPLVKFALNASINKTTGFTPFELVYGYVSSMIREVPEFPNLQPGIRALGAQAMQNLYNAHEAIIVACVF